MKLRVAGIAAMVALVPTAGLAGGTPSPSTLRSTLADPIDAAYVEADQGAPNTIEGPFDATRYADYAALTDPQYRQRALDGLKRNGFIAGYGREWYLPGTGNLLSEIVLAFANSSGAAAATAESKVNYSASKAITTFIDPAGVPNAFALTYRGADRFEWTIVIFTKGNDVFGVTGGSDSDYLTGDVEAQARRAFAFAPADTLTASKPAATPGFAVSLVLVTAVIGLLLLAGVLRPRRRV